MFACEVLYYYVHQKHRQNIIFKTIKISKIPDMLSVVIGHLARSL